MPSKIEKIYNESYKISRDPNRQIPLIKQDGGTIECRGLHRAMKKSFFPWKDWKTVPKKCGSSKKSGIMIHRQLQHYFGCMPQNHCHCGLEKFKPSKYLLPLVKYFVENGIVIDRTELPIYHLPSKTVTWVDAVGHYRNQPDSLVKISLKTGYSTRFYADSQGLVFENVGDSKIPCTTANIHHLQNLCEDIIMTETYDCKPTSSFTLYVYQEPTDQPGKYVIHCKRPDKPTWTMERVTKKRILQALKETA